MKKQHIGVRLVTRLQKEMRQGRYNVLKKDGVLFQNASVSNLMIESLYFCHMAPYWIFP